MRHSALVPCFLILVPFALSAAPVLTGVSSHRDQALYTTKETPEIYFTVTGLEPKQETKIKVRVTDDLDREIVKREFRVLADLQGMDGVGAFDIHRPFTFGSLILRKP